MIWWGVHHPVDRWRIATYMMPISRYFIADHMFFDLGSYVDIALSIGKSKKLTRANHTKGGRKNEFRNVKGVGI
jgi:hypothetical protein